MLVALTKAKSLNRLCPHMENEPGDEPRVLHLFQISG